MFGMPHFLLTAEQKRRQAQEDADAAEAEKRHFENVLVPNAVPWDPNFRRSGLDENKQICFKASTYELPMAPHFDAETTALNAATMARPQKGDIVGPSHGTPRSQSTWVYRHAKLPRGESLWVRFGNAPGEIFFDGDITFPVLYEWREWITYDRALFVWMSLTPMEVFSQRQGVRHCSGKVCIGGYGLGWFLEQVARKKSVTEIVIVEKDKQFLSWFAREHAKKVRKETGKKIKIVCADVYDYLADHHGEFDKIALDVFEHYGNNNAEDNAQLRKLLYPKGDYWSYQAEPLINSKKLWCWGSARIGTKEGYQYRW